MHTNLWFWIAFNCGVLCLTQTRRNEHLSLSSQNRRCSRSASDELGRARNHLPQILSSRLPRPAKRLFRRKRVRYRQGAREPTATFYRLCGVVDGRSSYVLDFAAAGRGKNFSSGR